jgi:hypothetical protein
MKAETVLNAFALAYHDSCRLAIWRPGDDTRAKWQRRQRQYQRFRTWLLCRMGEAADASTSGPAMPVHSFPASAVNAESPDATDLHLGSGDRHSGRRHDRRKPGRNRP